MSPLSDKHVLAVSDRSAAVWEYTAQEPPRSKSRHPYVSRTMSQGDRDRLMAAGADPSIYYGASMGGHDGNGGGAGGGVMATGAYDIALASAAAKEFVGLGAGLGGGGGGGVGGGSSMGGAGAANSSGGGRGDGTLLMGLGDQGDVKKVLNIKNMPDTAFTPSTLMLPALELRGASSMSGMNHLSSQEKGLGMPSKPQYVLYCISGHKLYAGTLPSYDKHNRETIHLGNSTIVDVSASNAPFSHSDMRLRCISNSRFISLYLHADGRIRRAAAESVVFCG